MRFNTPKFMNDGVKSNAVIRSELMVKSVMAKSAVQLKYKQKKFEIDGMEYMYGRSVMVKNFHYKKIELIA